jgi:hypothetical protein
MRKQLAVVTIFLSSLGTFYQVTMGDNDRSSDDPCESGLLVLSTQDNTLDCLQRFLCALREGRRQKDMYCLQLLRTEYTQEIAAGVVDVFQCCFSKRIQWKRLTVRLTVVNQNRFLHLILSEARRVRQFKEVYLYGPYPNRAALTNETAMELHAMMSSEQGLETLRLCYVRLLPGVLSTLSQGLLANRVGSLELHHITGIVMEREVIVDGEINGHNGEGRDGEMAYFIEDLRQNKSLAYLSLCGNNLSDETLSRVILALVDHPMLQGLSLNRNEGLDQTTRALCFLFDSDSCMLSELFFGAQSSPPRKINVGPLAEAIVRYGFIQLLDLSDNRLDNHDLVTLLDAASRCRTLVSLNLGDNDIGNLNLLGGIMQTHNPSRLRTLYLGGNPLGDDDRAALAKLVKDHPELQDFGFSEDEESLLITPATQCMLDLNRSGRVLLTNPSTPLSVWATVLERANRLSENETDSDVRTERQGSVIYGLLQGPAFAARSPNE